MINFLLQQRCNANACYSCMNARYNENKNNVALVPWTVTKNLDPKMYYLKLSGWTEEKRAVDHKWDKYNMSVFDVWTLYVWRD